MILVTGGAGYIGSHTCVALLQAGYEVLVLDNFCNSKAESLLRVAAITGKAVPLIQGDVRDREVLRQVFGRHSIDGVIHFAGLKAVGKSVKKPLDYYDNNVSGSVVLAEMMAEFGIQMLVFSSSATVYGDPASLPIREDFPTGATNPYGGSKLMVEQIYTDLAHSDKTWRIALLRYFNPVGAHISGTIGEDPSGIPNNLMPYVSQVAVGRRGQLTVFGDDYATVDGTGVRDYIHVMDLAEGHVRALAWLRQQTGVHVFNLGTGRGYSVLEMVRAFERASGCAVPYCIAPRRAGDVAEVYADPAKAERELNWKAGRDIEAMCRDSWNWQKQNPLGYPD
ncbi:MAG: UDP-glucose 4-epimerase GalE [Methylobacter sp.]|nr:UDP-glucose 4-epimerase GalE [Methylobacter sp.]MDP2099400.1 UDP-glucose 4-epimerase GalE [Methylobacter sp.]MDP2429905.1 UDP-glucose 4-epimerase GalE [Methylobacter sp.]MDP3053168.1 UDP-glucose 4-epimerase GalE [Methylobacter sp.]MDP3360553.1 UDP-glucose 4-epimerase GalE [Methylobacter sp.]